MRVELTASRVESLKTSRRQQDFTCHRAPGLTLRVSGITGRRTWLFAYRRNGTQRRVKLGTFPARSLAEARAKALELRTQVEAGRVPAFPEGRIPAERRRPRLRPLKKGRAKEPSKGTGGGKGKTAKVRKSTS